MTLETPLARVRGLGSAREGAHHWWVERLTLIATLMLFVWLLAALLSPGRGGSSPAGPAGARGPAAGELDTLKTLSDLHAQGRLTDEEFTAAKRKLLGLQ